MTQHSCERIWGKKHVCTLRLLYGQHLSACLVLCSFPLSYLVPPLLQVFLQVMLLISKGSATLQALLEARSGVMEAFEDEGIVLESVEVLSSRHAYEYSLQTKVLFPVWPTGCQCVPLSS